MIVVTLEVICHDKLWTRQVWTWGSLFQGEVHYHYSAILPPVQRRNSHLLLQNLQNILHQSKTIYMYIYTLFSYFQGVSYFCDIVYIIEFESCNLIKFLNFTRNMSKLSYVVKMWIKQVWNKKLTYLFNRHYWVFSVCLWSTIVF